MTIAILTGDCRNVLAGMPEASVDAVVTDPPYQQTSLAWDRWPDEAPLFTAAAE